MNYNYELNSLVDNPTTRVPVCLCLDTSGSMGRVLSGEFTETGETIYSDGQYWTLVEGGESAIQSLIEGANEFVRAVRSDNIAKYAVDLAVVAFGGDKPTLVQDFTGVDVNAPLINLVADGDTPMGAGVNVALDRLEQRKREYQKVGIDYFQPWLVLMTDGAPTGDRSQLERAISRTRTLIEDRKLSIFPIGIGDNFDRATLKQFSPRKPPLKLKGLEFQKFFEWLSKSVAAVSNSMPGDEPKLDTEGIKSWADLF